MSVFIVSENTTFRSLYIHILHVSAIFGHHQVVKKFLFALTVNTDVETNIICCRFARIVAHHPYVILVAVAVFAGTCLIIPLTTRKPPDFSDPQMVSIS